MTRRQSEEVNGHYLSPKRSTVDRARDGWGAVVRLRVAGIVAVAVPLILVVVLIALAVTGHIHLGG